MATSTNSDQPTTLLTRLGNASDIETPPFAMLAMSSARSCRFGVTLLGLWLLALLLALIQLGAVPLRDWDEGIVARVALELSQRPWPDWLLPTYLGSPYLNKPPGMHLLIAFLIRLWHQVTGPNLTLPPEWLIRLAPAVASSLLLPLLALVQRRLRPAEPRAALATAVICLTLLPLVRHGRLAMLDGSQLSAMALVWLGLLLADRSSRASLNGGVWAGLGGSALLLLKAPVAPVTLAVALLLRWLDRDLDRRAWTLLLGGLVIGLLPGLAWHGWSWWVRGNDALVMWGPQGIARFTSTLENHAGGPLVPLMQILQGGWPWLPLWPGSLLLAWRQRRQRAGRWALGLTLASLLMVFPVATQLPWYSLLIWPPFAITCGPKLAQLWPKTTDSNAAAARGDRRIGWIWLGLGVLMLAGTAISFTGLASNLSPLRWLLLAAGLALIAGSGLGLASPGSSWRRWAGTALVCGWCTGLALLMASPIWNWELNEQPPLDRRLLAGRLLPGEWDVTDTKNMQRPSYVWYSNAPQGQLEAMMKPPEAGAKAGKTPEDITRDAP